MKAKIYKPSKTAMQSGRSKFNKWVLKFNNNRNQKKDSLMGWNGGSNTISQVELKFDTREDAVNYAKRNDIEYVILESSERKVITKSYADNFK